MNNINGSRGDNGSPDDHISHIGREEAAVLSVKYQQKYGSPKYIFCSRANRALETATLLYPNHTFTATELLNERSWGDVVEIPKSKLQRIELDWHREKREDVLKRTIEFLNGLFVMCQNSDISAISHASLLNTLFSYINGDEDMHLEDMKPLPNGHCLGFQVYQVGEKIKFKYDPDRSIVKPDFYKQP